MFTIYGINTSQMLRFMFTRQNVSISYLKLTGVKIIM